MNELISWHIVEKDNIGDVLWSWAYPSVSAEEKELLLSKCNFSDSPVQYLYGRISNKWYYVNTTPTPDDSNIPNVSQVSLIVISKDFSPEKYYKLSGLLSKTYFTQGDPTNVLLLYLRLFTKGGSAVKENGVFQIDFGASFPSITMIKDLIKLFDLEVILIYNAVLLKKKLIVYHHHLNQLLKWIPTFPALVSHRNQSENLYPWFDLTYDDVKILSESKSYIIGCINSEILLQSDSYDIAVNLPAREITVSPNAKESFTMTKVHKEIALFMVQLIENDSNEVNILNAIAEKTQTLLNKIRGLNSDGSNTISLHDLKEKKFSPAAENFLMQLALTENMIIV